MSIGEGGVPKKLIKTKDRGFSGKLSETFRIFSPASMLSSATDLNDFGTRPRALIQEKIDANRMEISHQIFLPGGAQIRISMFRDIAPVFSRVIWVLAGSQATPDGTRLWGGISDCRLRCVKCASLLQSIRSPHCSSFSIMRPQTEKNTAYAYELMVQRSRLWREGGSRALASVISSLHISRNPRDSRRRCGLGRSHGAPAVLSDRQGTGIENCSASETQDLRYLLHCPRFHGNVTQRERSRSCSGGNLNRSEALTSRAEQCQCELK